MQVQKLTAYTKMVKGSFLRVLEHTDDLWGANSLEANRLQEGMEGCGSICLSGKTP